MDTGAVDDSGLEIDACLAYVLQGSDLGVRNAWRAGQALDYGE